MSHLVRGPNTIHIVGAGPEDAIGQALREAFGNVLFFPDKALPSQKSDLIVGLSPRADDQGLQSLIKWAHDAEVLALCVSITNDAALIGPLTLSGKVGCGRCAFARLNAAAADTESQTPALLSEIATRIAPALVREIQGIIRDGANQSELLDHILAVDLQTSDESLHKVIPLPRCTVCGGAAILPTTPHPRLELSAEDSPETVLGALAGWVDQRTGVISNLFIEPPDDAGMSLPIIATAAPPYLLETDGSLRRLPIGWGKGLTISGAVLSAVGEAIERYSASIVDPERIVWKRPSGLDSEFLDPRACSLYTEAQYTRAGFPYVRFDSDILHPWVLGTWADTGEPVWVPALFVFLSLELRQEQAMCQGTSNGLAASTDTDEASLRSILEIVERDAFMAAWLTGASGQRVEIDHTLDPLLRQVLNGIESLGGKVEVYTLPTSVIGTTVLCLACGDGEAYPGVTFGLGCELDPYAALRQAVLELGQTGPYLRRMMRSKLLTPPSDPGSVREMLDHAAYYFPKERATAFDRLRNSNSRIRLRDFNKATKRSLKDCVSILKAADVRVALIDVTSADVATGPFRVMRAVSPDLQPIWYGYGLERTPVERVRKTGIRSDVPPINPIW